ncbi:hypothetical protein EN981_11565 [Mesorhizobium sp. M7A.F.Ca.CA.001.13.2.1]|nr:hypothetical protein EN981_11565 [Mesorhizobium sp. M7A.F.Ca.CA.001.13.2.1]
MQAKGGERRTPFPLFNPASPIGAFSRAGSACKEGRALKLSCVFREWRQLAKPVPSDAELFPVPQNTSLVVPFGYRPKLVPPERRIAVFFHAYYVQELAGAIDLQLRNLPVLVDIHFTTDTGEKAVLLNERFQSHPRIRRLKTTITANRGRDIYPKIGLMNQEHLAYDYVLHIHTKRSGHEDGLRDWRQFLWQHLLGSPEIVTSVFEIFERCPDVGMIAPQHLPFIRPWIHWADCKELAAGLGPHLAKAIGGIENIDFPSGSMFWARSKALKPLLDLNLVATDFPEENGQLSLTNAHAIERLFFISCELAGLKWLKIALPQWHAASDQLQSASSPWIVRRFVDKRNVNLLPGGN